VEKGNERNQEKNECEAEIENLHDRAVGEGQSREIYLPPEQTPEEEVKDRKSNVRDSAQENENLHGRDERSNMNNRPKLGRRNQRDGRD